MSANMEQLIIENVMKELAKRGLAGNVPVAPAATTASAPVAAKTCCDAPDDEYITVPDISGCWVNDPVNEAAIKAMKETTPARIGLGRAGARPKTGALLKFLADHALAIDAVFMDVSDEFLQQNNLFCVQTEAANKDEFLKRPELGSKLSAEGIKTIQEKCVKGAQVQIIVVDGLSSSSIEANVPDVLPVLMQGLTSAGIKVGTPFFVRNGRVPLQNQIAQLLGAEVIISLIGERPGLVTADSMSAYIIYGPNADSVESDRTVFSNIHRGGTPPAEAGAHLVDVLKQILKAKASGIKFNQQ